VAASSESLTATLTMEHALKVEELERLSVKQGQRMSELQGELVAERKGHHGAKEQLASLAKRFAERDAAAARYHHERSEVAKQVARLKGEKRLLKAAARQFREESLRTSHELLMLRNKHALQQQQVHQQALQQQALQQPTAQQPPTVHVSASVAVPYEELDEAEQDLRLWAARVWTFYRIYFPAKSANAQCRETAEKFNGREMDLFAALYHKYDVAPNEQTFHTDMPPGWRDFR
jgi:uncharacterized membrane protein (DUF2068 family)